MRLQEAFDSFVKIRKVSDRYSAKCCKGLFAVDGPTKDEVEREARYYFVQYWYDGEYDDLIKP